MTRAFLLAGAARCWLLLLLVLAGLLLTGCSSEDAAVEPTVTVGPTPTVFAFDDPDKLTLDALPVYPAAEALPVDNPFVEGIEAGVRDALPSAVQIRTYTLPETSTFEDVQDFYTAELEDSAWETAPDFVDPVNDTISWVNTEQSQLFVVQVLAEHPELGDLLTLMVTEAIEAPVEDAATSEPDASEDAE